MRALGLLLLLCLLPAPHVAAETAEMPLWRALDWFRGAWRGAEVGLLGGGPTSRCTEDLFHGRFMLVRTRSEIDLLAPEGDHRRFDFWQMVARDPDSGRISLIQYESAGYHRRFLLDPEASRPDLFVFRAEFLGDAVPERAGRLTLRVLRGERYEELLELGEDDATLDEVRRSRWQRVEPAPEGCSGPMPDLPEP
jgi:hypothetical protein